EELARRAGVAEALGGDLGVRPQITTDVGGEPETIDAQSEHQHHGAAGEKSPKHCATTEKAGHRRTGGHAGLRRRNGRIEGGHFSILKAQPSAEFSVPCGESWVSGRRRRRRQNEILETLPQHRLLNLACRRMRNLVHEYDLVRHPPPPTLSLPAG